jgi:tRNA-2-methylthio-N6-dimethylallyladenosine synthase
MPYLHLPVQSGSDKVLELMNRGHSRGTYLDLVRDLRDVRGDLALSSDFIVGFPGETDADFEATLDLVREVGFAGAYAFKYSPRPGTPAAGHGTQVPEEVKSARLAALQKLLEASKVAFDKSLQGKTLEILLEKSGRHEGQVIGRSPYLQSVVVTNPPAAIGDLLAVTITEVGPNSLAGRVPAPASSRPLAAMEA